ncbi:hypothetical protein L2725_11705 [Shewanella corallii]|uniref:Phosphatidate cytidylyltransferase n=2 Tax=Shewanella TaxID=22 RepID=A0ABT0N7M1_9GAMM|nr:MULTISPECIES: hypothetical protein [Shewanella]MCL1038597.1 hypothetical protein [Shewanella submarina]MCL2914429.1 hypothetical protein [Shewanella corallii]
MLRLIWILVLLMLAALTFSSGWIFSSIGLLILAIATEVGFRTKVQWYSHQH